MHMPLFARKMFHRVPDPEKEASKFFSSPLNRLFYSQIKETIRIILDEVRISREFGLLIEGKHVEEEELFFLTALNLMGGPLHMLKAVAFDDASAVINSLMWTHFEIELKHYFELSEKRKEAVRNKYNCHLESVRNRILHEIYSEQNARLFSAL